MCSTSGAHYRQCAARTPAQRASAWKADRPDRALQGCQAVAVAVAQVAALQIQIQRRLQMIVPIRTITQHARDEITWRSEEHTSELQSLMRISYAVFCLKKKRKKK